MSLGQTGIEAKTTMAEKLKEKSDDRWWLKAVLALEVVLVMGLMAALVLAGLIHFDLAGWYTLFTSK